MGKRRMQDHPDYIDPNQMIALEEEMAALKKEYGIVDKPKWWMRLGDFIANHAGTRQPVPVYRKKYIPVSYTHLVGNQEKRKTENSGAASGAGICGCRKRMRGVAESLLPEYDWVKMSERPHEKGISG